MTRRKQSFLFGLAAVVVALFLLQVVQPAASQLTHGFSAYYSASRLVREGARVANFYDDRWFLAQTDRLGFVGAEDIYNLNPPTTALLFWPLSGLSPREAKAVWTGVDLLLLGLVLGAAIRVVGGGAVEVAVGVVLIAFFQPLREDLRLGQVYILLLALEMLLLRTYLDRRSAVAGISLGLIIGFKTSGAGLLLFLIAGRSWRLLGWVGLTVGAIFVGTLPLLGLASWKSYVDLLSRFDAHPELAVTAYQSVPGLALHLFLPDETWNRAPLLAAPGLATILLAALAIMLIGLTFQRTLQVSAHSPRDHALAFAAWAILDVALSPVSEDYHYTLLLVPIAILLAEWRDAQPGPRWLAILVVGVVLVGAPLPYKTPLLAEGGWAILAYPKLYGALALWGLAISALRRLPKPTLPSARSSQRFITVAENP